MEQTAFLSVSDVHKRFANVHAVAGISLAVAPGEIFALLGPNGAGKSTLLRMLVGIMQPDSGVISWAGPTTERGALIPSAAGYLPEDRGLYQDMPLLKTLSYFGQLRGMSATDATRTAQEWLERLSLSERVNDKLGTLSKGNQQKVQFAAAILHRPRFAILDEPFSGLDPLNQELFLRLVRELRDGGTTVLLSAHQMSLVERIADRVFVMHLGRELLHGTVPEIRERWGAGERLFLRVRGAADLRDLQVHDAVQRVVQQEDGTIAITLSRGHQVGDLLALCSRSFTIESVRTEQPTLHDVYIATVSGESSQDSPEAA